MGDTKAYSNNKVLCSYVNANNIKCKAIALSKSLYCRHHVKYDTSLKALDTNQENQKARYTSPRESVRERININLASPSLLDLRHEIALLQAWLQELMDAPVTHFDKQLQVIDRIERLVTNFQRVKLSAQALAQAENKVKLVINNVVLIIKGVVTDKEQRQEIARRLAELGNAYDANQDAVTLGAGIGMPDFINTQQAPINNSPPVLSQAPVSAVPQAARTGDPGAGTGTESEIPSPCQEPSPSGSPENPIQAPGAG